MIKTLAAANKSEREHFKIPRSVQQSIPIQRIYRDGIWMVNGKYSRTWRFADINYSVASHEDQQEMFLSYCGVLNSLPTGATAKITINNRRLNGTDFQHSVLMRLKGDGLDKYRQEYNGILMEKAVESNNLIQDKYITMRATAPSAFPGIWPSRASAIARGAIFPPPALTALSKIPSISVSSATVRVGQKMY